MGALSAVYALCTLSFIVLSRHKTDARLTNDILHHNARLLKDIKSYEIITPYRLEGRKKRHASTKIASGHLQDTTIVFPGKKKSFHLDISLNTGLFSPQFEETSSDDPKLVPHEHCFYHGTVRGEDNSDVSLSTCDGIEGIIRTDDGTFFIQPLKSQDGQVSAEHVMFDANDVNEQPATCGHSSHKKSFDREIHSSHSTDFKKRVRRDALSETKYIEFFIINDKKQFEKYGEKTELRAKQLVNHLDSIYRFRKIRIALVKVETWKDKDLITVHRNASITLSNFLEYKKNNLVKYKGKHFDNVQLITALDFAGTTVGYAPILSICGRRSAAIVQDYSSQAASTASTMAHELGHNLGMRHDESTCLCPDNNEKCVMSAFSSGAATRFSTCSINYLKNTIEKGYAQCLFDEPTKLFGGAICGNGFVEEGEQCDCGTQEECDHFQDKCCNATSCTLLPGARCSHGECCENCQIKQRGTLCRAEKTPDDCDLPEFCTGENEKCPEDHHVYDGISCHDNKGYCYGGICRNVELQCQLLFGKDIKAGYQWCFDRNTAGNDFLNCHDAETNGYFACPEKDVNCGRIHCLTDKRAETKLIKGQDRSFSFVSRDGINWCIAPKLSWGDGRDPQYVEDGTKCGEGKMCMNSRCIPVAEAVPISAHIKCPLNCSGNGVCNSNGNCHCNKGFACPDCKEFRSDDGGSVDSGQGCPKLPQTEAPPHIKCPLNCSGNGVCNSTNGRCRCNEGFACPYCKEIGSGGQECPHRIVEDPKSSSVNVAAAVVIPLILLLLIGIAILVYIKRRTIQDRLRLPKFARPSTFAKSSSASPPPKSAPASFLNPSMISNPIPADQPVVQSNRPLPRRFRASLVKNEQPDPQSTPPQVPRGPLKPPGAPAQREAVALFPPSGASVPQETVKPPLPPPTRPTATRNIPGTPPTSQNRPKLPPNKNTAGNKFAADKPPATDDTSRTPPVPKKPNVVPPRPKPSVPPGSHQSVPDVPVPVPKPKNVARRPGHHSVPQFNLPDNPEDGGSVKPSDVKANQAKPSPPRRPRANEDIDENRVDFRAGLKPVPKPWENSKINSTS